MRSLDSSPESDKTHVRKYCKVDYSSTTLRCSARLSGKSSPLQGKVVDLEDSGENCKKNVKRSLSMEEVTPPSARTGILHAKLNYEELRKARILENQARLASIGLLKTISDLRSLTSAPISDKTHVRKNRKVNYSPTPVRRSARLSGNGESHALKGNLQDLEDSGENSKKSLKMRKISPEALARRCASKGRGSLYDPVYGICCHFCRQKKLCGEEDCRRCSKLDMDQPCIGKTDCSICHSSNGILCRGCLKVRYGQEMEEVRSNKEWMCPHCVEDKGLNPYWICNSSLCLQRRKMIPTGIAIFRAREMGFKSVAHLLMEELQQEDRKRGRDV